MTEEWEDARAFYKILEKLDLDDLKALTHIFGCYPSYYGEVDKAACTSYIWTKLREWKRGTEDSQALRQALFVLGVGR